MLGRSQKEIDALTDSRNKYAGEIPFEPSKASPWLTKTKNAIK